MLGSLGNLNRLPRTTKVAHLSLSLSERRSAITLLRLQRFAAHAHDEKRLSNSSFRL